MKLDTEQLAEFLQQLLEQAARAGAEQALANLNIDDKLISVEEAAKRMGISKQCVRSMINAGELEAHYCGRLIRLRWSEICTATKNKQRQVSEN